jgi:hypothetical protein
VSLQRCGRHCLCPPCCKDSTEFACLNHRQNSFSSCLESPLSRHLGLCLLINPFKMANPDISLFVPPPPDPARSRTPEIRQPPDVSNDYTGYPALPSAPSPYGAPHPTFPSPYFPMEAGMYHGGGPPPAWMIQPDPFGHPFGHPRFQQYNTYQPQAQRSLEPPKVGDRVDPFMAGNHCMFSGFHIFRLCIETLTSFPRWPGIRTFPSARRRCSDQNQSVDSTTRIWLG